MRTIAFFLIFICMTDAGSAQQTVIDSLQNKIKTHPEPDTIKLDALIDLAFYYKDTEPSKGIEFANEAILLSEKLRDKKRLATAYNYAGVNYTAQGNDTVALLFFNKSLGIRQQLNDKKGIASTIHNMGMSYFNLSDYSKALEYQEQAFEILKSIDNKTGMAITLNSIGVVYLYLSDYRKALNNYLNALHTYEQSGDEKNMAIEFINIGLVYNHLGDYNKSLEYQLRALDISKKSGDLYNVQNELGNIGETYDDLGNKTRALSFFREAIAINEKIDNNRGIASNLINTGILYNGIGNYDSAFFYLKKALKLYRLLNDKYGMSNALSYISNSYLKAPDEVINRQGIRLQERYEKAIELQQRSLQMASEIGNLSTEGDGWSNLSDIYIHKKDFAKALNAFKIHIAIRDSISGNEKKSEINRIVMQYDFDKKEAATKAAADKLQTLASAEIKRQRIVKNTVAFGAAILLAASVFIFIFYKRKRDAEEQQKEAEYKVEVAETEMKALRAQMNPHFIFNSLNSIGDYISKHDVTTANYYLGKFAKMMRLILENSEHTQVSLADDLNALELYMQLEALRLNDKFTYEIKVDEEIDQENTMVPPMILQPFVENSIWHGIAHNEGKGNILIEIKKENEMIHCMVEDDGIGRKIDEMNHNAKRSFGLKITKSRIEIMDKLKKTKGGVQLFDMAKGTRVEVKFPLALNF
jgi:tetratricopeptide (TPR) repeat protein/anti-sigma regulatory factor (Ser/Thr protein kinase)